MNQSKALYVQSQSNHIKLFSLYFKTSHLYYFQKLNGMKKNIGFVSQVDWCASNWKLTLGRQDDMFGHSDFNWLNQIHISFYQWLSKMLTRVDLFFSHEVSSFFLWILNQHFLRQLRVLCRAIKTIKFGRNRDFVRTLFENFFDFSISLEFVSVGQNVQRVLHDGVIEKVFDLFSAGTLPFQLFEILRVPRKMCSNFGVKISER